MWTIWSEDRDTLPDADVKQQPVASDLRHISTALKVVTDLERMGDQAADIADLSLRLEDADISLVSKHLPPWWQM